MKPKKKLTHKIELDVFCKFAHVVNQLLLFDIVAFQLQQLPNRKLEYNKIHTRSAATP